MFFPLIFGGRIETDGVGFANNVSPFIHAYSWSASGLGSKLSDPGSFPPAQCLGISFTGQSNAIAVAHDTSPYLTAYPWTVVGFGTKYSNPGTLPPANGKAIAFTRNDDTVAIGNASAGERVTAYPWSTTGFGTKYSDPSPGLPDQGNGVAFSPNGDVIVIAHHASPYVTAYAWSSSGFGAKYSDPGTLPTGNAMSVDFSRQGSDVAVGHETTPFFSIYPWSGGFGSKYTLAGTGMNTGRGVRFSPTGGAILMVFNTTSPFVKARPFASGSGVSAAFSDPSTPPEGSSWSASFTASGNAVSIGHNSTAGSNSFSIYPWDDSTGFGTEFADPSPVITGSGWGTAFNGRS